MDARTWHGFTEEFDDVAPPGEDHVRFLGFVILKFFRFVLGGEQKVLDATPLAHELQSILDLSISKIAPRKHDLCIATVRVAAVFSSPDEILSDPDYFGEEIFQQASRQGPLRHTSVPPIADGAERDPDVVA